MFGYIEAFVSGWLSGHLCNKFFKTRLVGLFPDIKKGGVRHYIITLDNHQRNINDNQLGVYGSATFRASRLDVIPLKCRLM